MRLAAVEGSEAGQQVDEFAAGRWWGAGCFQLVPAPDWRRARGGHGVHHQRSPRRRVGKVPLPGGRGKGAVAHVQAGG